MFSDFQEYINGAKFKELMDSSLLVFFPVTKTNFLLNFTLKFTKSSSLQQPNSFEAPIILPRTDDPVSQFQRFR